jgi:hypothetical protein
LSARRPELRIDRIQENAMLSTRALRWAAFAAVAAALALTFAAPTARADDDDRPAIPLKDARLKIEFNATDRDAGVQLFVDAEPWKSLAVHDPRGRLIFQSTARGVMARQGGTELFLESGEPSLDEVSLETFLKRFPQGSYRIVAKGTDGVKQVGSARFTHNIPAGPALLSPPADAVVSPNNLVVQWQPVPAVNGSPIIAYQVLVVQPNSGLPALPKLTLDVMMPPTATSLAVPPGFLQPDTAYEWEVLAIEAGGNQTLSSRLFRTSK